MAPGPMAISGRKYSPPMKLRLLSLGMVALFWCSSAFTATVDFVQITDPHIFDCKGDVEGNKEALKWCINQINGRAGAKADYKFIVVTGDLGLEGLPCGGNEKEPGAKVDRAKELADIIKQSTVKRWLFLPGNNDLVEENPADIGTFHRFIKTLKDQLPEMQIVDFCPVAGDGVSSGVLDLGECRFIGFNNASFKSNDSGADAATFEPKQLENVDEVLARLADPRFKSAYIFYHIPEIDDPYCVSLDPNKPEDNEVLKKRETSRGDIGKPFPCSAWTVTPAVREKWNQVVANERVKGLFAGHFHSAEHESYDSLSWIRSAGYSPGSPLKLHVCPPVASKKQEDKSRQARGFREVSVDCEKGKTKSKIFWYEKNTGALKILEKDMILSVDPASNSASGLIHLSNPTEKEISLSLNAEDFKSSTGDYGLNAKTLFALATESAAGQQVLEAKLKPSSTIAVKVDVSNFWEAGEATANLCNYGEPIGKLRATKWRPSFGVKIVAAVPDKPEFTFTKGKTRQITLKNEDAMTYPVILSAEVDGIQAGSSRITLPPNSSVPIELKTNDDWFPASARVKETVRDGNIRIQWQPPRAGNQPLPERVIPFKAHLNSTGEFWQSFWGYGFVLVFVTLGGVCSMILSNWVPNRLSRAGVEEQLSDLARKTTSLSSRIDSGLRVFLRVERNRLHRLLRSQWILSANFPDVVKRAGDYLAVLTKQIDLAGKLDRAREALEPRLQTNPIPAKIEQIDRDLQKAADTLRRCDCSTEDLDEAKVLIAQASDRISKMDQTDDELVKELSTRIEALKSYVQPAKPDDEPPARKELKRVIPTLFTRFDPAALDKLDPTKYSPIDFLATQLELLRQYEAYYAVNPPLPNLPTPEAGKKLLDTETFGSLQRARLWLKEIKEGIYVDRIESALGNNQAEIVIEPAPSEDQLLRFSIRFHSDELNTAAARDELRCEWDFGDHTLTENGWDAYHYFQPPYRKLRQRFWRWVRPWRKPESRTFKVTATFSRKNPDPTDVTKPITFSRDHIKVREAPRNPSADRNLAEIIRLGIALIIALIGLLAGAREQLTKLDLIPAAIAVFLLGFGADTIKNLISPKQAPKPAAS
jgi:calcineurin-like phosphoesterase family protein